MNHVKLVVEIFVVNNMPQRGGWGKVDGAKKTVVIGVGCVK
jgi:hypothetical protein